MIKKVQIYGNPSIHGSLKDQIKSDFTDCEISVTDSEIIEEQDQYFVSISSLLKDVYLNSDRSPLFKNQLRNKVVLLKASDLDWEKEVEGVEVVHKKNYSRIKEIIAGHMLNDDVLRPGI